MHHLVLPSLVKCIIPNNLYPFEAMDEKDSFGEIGDQKYGGGVGDDSWWVWEGMFRFFFLLPSFFCWMLGLQSFNPSRHSLSWYNNLWFWFLYSFMGCLMIGASYYGDCTWLDQLHKARKGKDIQFRVFSMGEVEHNKRYVQSYKAWTVQELWQHSFIWGCCK